MPQHVQTPTDELDAFISSLPPEEQEEIRRQLKPFQKSVIGPARIAESEKAVRERPEVKRTEQAISALLGIAAGIPSPAGMAIGAVLPPFLAAVTGQEELYPSEVVSPINASNATAFLTNMLTRKIPGLAGATKFSPLLGREALEQGLPTAALFGEAAREGSPIDPMSPQGSLAIGLPAAIAPITAAMGARAHQAATTGPYVTGQAAQRFKTAPAGGPVPGYEEAFETLGEAQKKAGIASRNIPKIAKLEEALPPGASQRAQQQLREAAAAAGLTQEEVETLTNTLGQRAATGRLTKSPMEDELATLDRDIRLAPVQKRIETRALEQEIAEMESRAETTRNGMRRALIRGQIEGAKEQLEALAAESDVKLERLITQRAKLKRDLAKTKEQTAVDIGRLREELGGAKVKGKVDQKLLTDALNTWEQTGRNEDELRVLTNYLSETTGWNKADLGPTEMKYIKKMVATNPAIVVDEVVGSVLEGGTGNAKAKLMEFADVADKLFTAEEKLAFQAATAHRIIDDVFDPSSSSLRTFLAKPGTGGRSAFGISDKPGTPGGLTRLGEEALNKIFGSPKAYENLKTFAKLTEQSQKPGMRMGVVGTTMAGALGFFFWSWRFAEQRPEIATAAFAGGMALVGLASWPNIVNNVVRKAHTGPDGLRKAFFQSMEQKALMPAQGSTSAQINRSIMGIAERLGAQTGEMQLEGLEGLNPEGLTLTP